jgi:hypothetical protein
MPIIYKRQSESIPLIPYSYGVEGSLFSLELYTIGRTPWTSDRPVARPLPTYRTTQTQNKRTHTHTHTHTPNMYALSGTRTHDHSVRAREDSACLRPLGYHDRLLIIIIIIIIIIRSVLGAVPLSHQN